MPDENSLYMASGDTTFTLMPSWVRWNCARRSDALVYASGEIITMSHTSSACMFWFATLPTRVGEAAALTPLNAMYLCSSLCFSVNVASADANVTGMAVMSQMFVMSQTCSPAPAPLK